MYKLALTSILLLVLASGAHAKKGDSEKDGQHVTVDVHGAFQEQRKTIEAELSGGETYSEISQNDRAAVREALDRISVALQAPGGFPGLVDEQKASVTKDQDMVNGILARAAADSRLVCKREKKIGTNRVTTQCMTALQRNLLLEESRKAMNQGQRNNL